MARIDDDIHDAGSSPRAFTLVEVPLETVPADLAVVTPPSSEKRRRGDVFRPGPGPMVQFQGVIKRYDGDVRGSGSGKSTFIRLCIRELRATSGHVIIGGRDLGELKRSKVPYLRRAIGCVFQDFRLLPDRTASENVAYALQVTGHSRQEVNRRVPEILALVGLDGKGDRLPRELSGGEQQRVSIARALVNQPRLLIADEPTGNLDPDTSQGIMDLLTRINRTGTTVLVATHDRDTVDRMQQRVIALHKGRIVRDAEGGYNEDPGDTGESA